MVEDTKNSCKKLADEFATKGSVKHFALRLGFMPHDEKDAEAILANIVDQYYELEFKSRN